MKYETVYIISSICNFINVSKKKEKFLSYDLVLEKDFPYLIKDESEVYFQSYKCLDYEDIRI